MNTSTWKFGGFETNSTIHDIWSKSLPYVPTYVHLLSAALLPIVAGAYGSLSRPNNCSPKVNRSAKATRHSDTDNNEEEEDEEEEEEEEDDDEEQAPLRENLSNWDAIGFPIVAGMALLGLYLIIQYTSAVLLNKIMSTYLTLMSVFAVGRLSEDFLGLVQDFLFPKCWKDLKGNIYRIRRNRVKMSTEELPDAAVCAYGHIIGRILSLEQRHAIIEIKQWLRAQIGVTITSSLKQQQPLSFSLRHKTIIGYMCSIPIILLYYFWSGHKPWYLTNVLGTAFSYTAIQFLSPASFPTASLLLSALFLYDIFFVFYTPLMVTVATQLDIPIKMLFPRPPDAAASADAPKPLAMLGLGDIVLPGIVIALALRFDLWRYYEIKRLETIKVGQKVEPTFSGVGEKDNTTTPREDWKPEYKCATGNWGTRFWMGAFLTSSNLDLNFPYTGWNFPKPYFFAAVIGYIFGMAATIVVMHAFSHAQPALLYLVPSVLVSIWCTGLYKREITWLWMYSEHDEEDNAQNNPVSTTEASLPQKL